MKVSTDDDGSKQTPPSEIHSISFGWNRIQTPPSEDEANRNQMISDVVSTPRSKKKQISIGNMD